MTFIQEFGYTIKLNQWQVLLVKLSVIKKNMPSFVIVGQYRLKRSSRRWRNSWPSSRNQRIISTWWPWSLNGNRKEIDVNFFSRHCRGGGGDETYGMINTSSLLNRSMWCGPDWKSMFWINISFTERPDNHHDFVKISDTVRRCRKSWRNHDDRVR